MFTNTSVDATKQIMWQTVQFVACVFWFRKLSACAVKLLAHFVHLYALKMMPLMVDSLKHGWKCDTRTIIERITNIWWKCLYSCCTLYNTLVFHIYVRWTVCRWIWHVKIRWTKPSESWTVWRSQVVHRLSDNSWKMAHKISRNNSLILSLNTCLEGKWQHCLYNMEGSLLRKFK